jgi:regulator of sigma E protease
MTIAAFLMEQAQNVGWFAFYAFAFLIVLTVVVFVHELGHFLVARWCGVDVQEFAIGFGKEITGFNDRHGTRWKFCWIPLGGYVKFMDDEDAASGKAGRDPDSMSAQERAGAYHLKPVWQRSAVVAAGPIANFIFAIVVFALMFWIFGVRMTAPKVDEVMPNMPAAEAGLQAGDVIRKINGTNIRSFNDVQRFVSTSIDQTLDVVVDRGGSLVTVKLTPKGQEIDDGMGGKMIRGMIGVRRAATPESYVVEQPGPIEALQRGFTETGFVITSTLGYIRDIFVGRQNASQIGGLPHIAEVTKRVIDFSPERLPYLIAMISVTIGLMNLFPIPVLDGGHLMFYAIEALRGKPLSERTQDYAFRAGFAVLVSLMIFANLVNGWPIMARWFGLEV